MEVKVAISARHIHLCKEDLEILFGKDYELNKRNDLSQKGEFASNEKVIIRNNNEELALRVLGPIRSYTQVEISKTDSYKLGLDLLPANSGELDLAKEVLIIGPKGEIKRKCCIISNRHIHISDIDSKKYGLFDGDKVKVKVNTKKGAILDNVYIKVNKNYVFEMHIDTDDANALLLNDGDIVEII